MTIDQADMLLDSYFRARMRRIDLMRQSDVLKADRDEARNDFRVARETLVHYLRQVKYQS